MLIHTGHLTAIQRRFDQVREFQDNLTELSGDMRNDLMNSKLY